MRNTRRGFILGASALLSGCSAAAASATRPVVMPLAETAARPASIPTYHVLRPRPVVETASLDLRGVVRDDLVERAKSALEVHGARITNRDKIYLVDFTRHSSEPRLHEVDMEAGKVTTLRTAHGRGSDPQHTGYARNFSNVPDSHCSSIGAFVTDGASWGAEQGPNVILEGLEPTNDKARERAIIIHGADYADPDFLAREGKLGRSYGCFSVAHADLPGLRERMGYGRLLYAWS